MFTGLTNTIVNLFTPGGESGAKMPWRLAIRWQCSM